jgi:hypothetical protein
MTVRVIKKNLAPKEIGTLKDYAATCIARPLIRPD